VVEGEEEMLLEEKKVRRRRIPYIQRGRAGSVVQ
jgi:hypothetical protein